MYVYGLFIAIYLFKRLIFWYIFGHTFPYDVFTPCDSYV